jgi:hypothetical protein
MRKLVPLFLASAAGVVACGSSTKSGDSISCNVAVQFICYDIANPTSAQLSNLPVKCSSDSGDYKTPAACPQTGYLGKCTFAAPDGTETDRFYTGADAAYQQSFCETVSLGTWSTAF